MSCRSTPANSAFTTLAQLQGKRIVPNSTVLHIFHHLKNSTWFPPLSEAQYKNLIAKKIEETNKIPSSKISDTQRATIIARLREAKTEGMPEDRKTVYALQRLSENVAHCENGIKNFSKNMADQMGLPKSEVEKHFLEVVNSMPRSTANHKVKPIKYSKEEIEIAEQYLFHSDKSLLYGVHILNEELKAIQRQILKDSPPRITLTQIDDSPTGLKNKVLTHYGYDYRNERLEIRIKDTVTGKSKDYAYTRVGQEEYDDFLEGGEPGVFWSNEIRGEYYRQYRDEHEAKMAGITPKCSNCGQFATIGHGCPMLKEPYIIPPDSDFDSSWSRETVGNRKIKLPSASLVNNALLTGAVHIAKIEEEIGFNYVVGGVTIYLDEENNIRLNSSQLSCNCNDYLQKSDCPEIELIRKSLLRRTKPVKDMLNGVTARKQAQLVARAQKKIILEEEAMLKKISESDWTLSSKGLLEAKRNWQSQSEVLYSKDFDSFKQDYDEAVKARKDANKFVIPFMKSNALGGMATRESNQGFGVEIEYEFPDSWDYASQAKANRKIGEALYALSITSEKYQSGYHDAMEKGYVDTQKDEYGNGNWSFEEDGTVNGGEIVSPIMYDEEESWENLEKVIKILRDNGAVPTTKAGSHVHVGTKMYGRDPGKYAELLRMITQHEDVAYRLGTDPERGTHRGIEYARPNESVKPAGFKSISSLRSRGRKYNALNLSSVRGNGDDNVEFRLFDSTIDAGAIQAQVKLAVAMTHAALRVSEQGGTKREKEALGIHVKKNKILNQLGKDVTLEEETTTLRSLLDTLFIRREDKKQLVAIFANTKWSNPKMIRQY